MISSGRPSDGTHFRKFSALLCLQYGPAKAGFRLKAALQTSARVFVVPSFSRNAALFDYTATLVVRFDLNNFTFASTLQDKVSAIRRSVLPH